MLNAFCRVAPSDLFSFLAIRPAGVFLRAIDFSSRTSVEVQARRFFDFLAIKPPFQERQFVSLTGVNEKSEDGISEHLLTDEPRPHGLAADMAGELRKSLLDCFLARHALGSK
jgi:hypothetical protein